MDDCCFQIPAVDEDSGQNSKLNFSMAGDGPFSVDSLTGEIVLEKEVDRETVRKQFHILCRYL